MENSSSSSSSSSSKVTVEYFDPSGVFSSIAPSLLARLPLKNLHWKSPSRPTRSINSLHVDLVAHEESIGNELHRTNTNESSTSRDSSSRPRGPTVEQKTIPDAGKGTFKGPLKERRHQIPGLRQTPYLKLYLLRCDDHDTYKNTSRKLLREWIKQHSQSAASVGGQDNHDASEWLIVHVVLPNTPAAAQPRYSGSNDTTSTAEKGSRWPGRGSPTILEKVRSDFNGSSKNPKDRVCQLRTVPNEEAENDWLDLIAKMKSLILTSFDLRVSQYEEDIREKEIQRSLPGWNFCTFFVLKEGLARGFESVGLVEDARIGYDELSVGLDTVIREQLDSNESQAGAFLPFTEDMRRQLEHHLQGENLEEDTPISASKKKYRELILANNISVFDFNCYIFARQLSLLLRLANSQSSREYLGSEQADSQSDAETENMLVLAEICRRGLSFVSSVSRTLRKDLIAGYASAHPGAQPAIKAIENMVCSWSYSACQQILAETSTKSLPIPWSAGVDLDFVLKDASASHEPKVSNVEPKTILHPARSSSLQDPLENRNERSHNTANQPFLKTGLERLAAFRAEIYLLLRSSLQHTAIYESWLSQHKLSELTAVPLDNDESEPLAVGACGISNPQLKKALEQEADMLGLYEMISEKALRHYKVADRQKSADRVLSDIAILKFQTEDYVTAAKFMQRIIPGYSQEGWTLLKHSLVQMHATSVKKLGRTDDYIRIITKALAEIIGIWKENNSVKNRESPLPFNARDLAVEYFTEMLEHAKTTSHSTLPLLQYFGDLRVEKHIDHLGDRDGFQMRIYVQNLLQIPLSINRATLRLVSVEEGHSEILLSCNDTFLKPGSTKLTLTSSTTTLGMYKVDRVCLYANKLCFAHTFSQSQGDLATPVTHGSSTAENPRVYLYPQSTSLTADISWTRTISLNQNRSIDISISTGRNEVMHADLRLKPASAGLRLHVIKAEMMTRQFGLDRETAAGILSLEKLPANTTLALRVPYSLERDLSDISIRIELKYTTKQGDFVYTLVTATPVQLPLGVNVRDVFKSDSLYSTFSVQTATNAPLRILKSQLESSSCFSTEKGGDISSPLLVFPNQSVSLVYKITRSRSADEKTSTPLSLKIEYRCLDEEIYSLFSKRISEQLAEEKLDGLSRLLLPAMLATLKTQITSQDLDKFGLLGEIDTSLTKLPKEVVSALDEKRAAQLALWLAKRRETFTLRQSNDTNEKLNREIIIPVEVPQVQVVHTVDLNLLGRDKLSRPVAVGQVLRAELTISHTRAWDFENGDAQSAIEFVYELQTNSELWLVGGAHRAQFSAKENEVRSFPILLIPLQAGHLLLPSVDIQPFKQRSNKSQGRPAVSPRNRGPISGQSADEFPGAEDSSITCEVDQRSQGQSVLVIVDVTSTTVDLESTGINGSARLLESSKSSTVQDWS